MAATETQTRTVVLHVGGLRYASEKAVVEGVLGRRPGVLAVEANPVAQTATVTFDPGVTSVEGLRRCVEECGYHCAGRSVPGHVCDPLAEEGRDAPAHDHAATMRADHADGHGHGGHAGMYDLGHQGFDRGALIDACGLLGEAVACCVEPRLQGVVGEAFELLMAHRAG